MSSLLKMAFQEYGLTGTLFLAYNPRIFEYAQELSFKTDYEDETPWRSIFVNYWYQHLNLSEVGQISHRFTVNRV